MPVNNYVQLPQNTETPVLLAARAPDGPVLYRYAYARSADTRSIDKNGQDYLVLQSTRTSFVFALCDGVSQSFFGDIAARLLGNSLLGWLVEGLPDSDEAEVINERLDSHLRMLTAQGTQTVQEYKLPGTMPPMLQEVLEQKRASGSDSTFICGRIDLPGRVFPHGRVVLAWMGDSRLRVWGPGGKERTNELGDTFKTEQRWSSARGPVNGEPHIIVSPLVYKGKYAITRLLVYSDGLASLDEWSEALANEDLQVLIDNAGRAATSDDISVLEIWTDPNYKLLRPGLIRPSPEPGPGAANSAIALKLTPAVGSAGSGYSSAPLAGIGAERLPSYKAPAPYTILGYPGQTAPQERPDRVQQLLQTTLVREKWTTARIVGVCMLLAGLVLFTGALCALALSFAPGITPGTVASATGTAPLVAGATVTAGKAATVTRISNSTTTATVGTRAATRTAVALQNARQTQVSQTKTAQAPKPTSTTVKKPYDPSATPVPSVTGTPVTSPTSTTTIEPTASPESP